MKKIRKYGIILFAGLCACAAWSCEEDKTDRKFTPKDPVIKLGGDVEVGKAGGSYTVPIESNLPWRVRSEADWILLGEVENGMGDGEFTFTVSPNKTLFEPVASQHGQHVGNRIQNLTGVPVAEAARGVGRRSEPRLKLFDPADKLPAGAVIIMAHMSRNCGGSYKGNIIPGSRRLFPDKTDYRRNQSDKCSSARERHPEFHAGAVRNRHRQHSAEPPRRRANRRCVPGGTHPDEHQRRQAPVR